LPDTLLSNEPIIYAFLYFGALGVVAIWEALAPRRVLTAPLRMRWLNTMTVYLADVSVLRLLFPLLGVGVAIAAQERGWGLFNVWAAPVWLVLPVSLLAIDASHYLQHYLFHRLPPLWRIHRMHHTDHDYDFTTGLRFHPLESVLTTAFDLSVIIALGAPPLAVIAYEFVYVVISIAVHGNVRVPVALDRVLRIFIVTPDLHRVHHSAAVCETDSNFGSVLPWWDRLLGTYVAQPARGHEGMEIGLPEFRDPKHLTFWWMLVNPLLRAPLSTERMHAASTQTVPVSWNETAKVREG
jgi:sterol desaturase/sphingolipid hydroxylase (fatty acid hydroxylase superfamily)